MTLVLKLNQPDIAWTPLDPAESLNLNPTSFIKKKKSHDLKERSEEKLKDISVS